VTIQAPTKRGMHAPIPANEKTRLDFLHNLKLDYSVPYEEIQGLCEVASKVADAPIALVSLVDETQQKFLAGVGLGDTRQTDREIAFCAHSIMSSRQLEVPDALLDSRFSKNPLVVDAPRIRSYLGTVLEPEAEIRIGTLCVMDTQPHAYSNEVKDHLSRIGKAITALLVAHREKLELADYSRGVARQNAKLIDLTISLKNSMEKLIAAEKVKSEFLAVVSHELRTPLTSIKGSLALLKVNTVSADAKTSQRLINIAYENSERLHSLVEDLLQLEKGEFRNSNKALTPVDLADLIEASADAYRNYAVDRDVTLTVLGAEKSCLVNGDRNQLDRVLANILSNACKFSNTGGEVEIALHCFKDGPQITVKDQGVGIPQGFNKKVFESFSQVECPDTRSKGGAGLGLYICKQILRQHNATIDYESELGAGTTFRVDFPPLGVRDAPNQ